MNNIPKVIHYFWFGNNPKPEIVTKCIASWKKYMPDWEIKEWNENNYDVHCCEYVEQAYAAKKWAFVSDYARFDILNRYGGLYLDTDVEILKEIPTKYFESPFTAVDNNGIVAPGLIVALPSGHWLSQLVLKSYKYDGFHDGKLTAAATINTRVKEILLKKGYEIKDDYQKIQDMIIYPSELFCVFDVNTHEYDITSKTLSVHHYASSWMTDKQLKKRKIQSKIKKAFGISTYRKLLRFKRAIFGISKE